MPVKDLSAFITPDLVLKVGDKNYTIQPPSKDDGKIMTALNVAGLASFTAMSGACTACGRSGDVEMDPTMRALVEANAGRDLGELSMGAAYDQMIADGVDGPTIEKLELYCFYYWVLGETAADQIFEQQGQAALPKGQRPSKSGRSTGSGNPSKRRKVQSTRTTGSRKG